MAEYEPKSCFATLPRTKRGLPIVLGGDPKGKNFLYCNNNSVIIRDIANPAISDIYTEHSCITTVAKYSPSGFYIASGDVSGKVRIWDTINKEHILKNEFQPLGGCIKDISWSSDSQRIVVGGEGREKFAHVFSADTGTSVGEIMGHGKSINSVDFRPARPLRIATASEDMTVAFHQGPPFKFQTTLDDHTQFVNVVRYAPDGSVFMSGGAEGKVFIYDGISAEKKGELGNPAHKGGIYALSFSPDSRQVLTVSGDKTAKIWDVETESVVNEFVMGKEVEDMQVGCLWQGDYLLTVSLSGNINYLDVNNTSRPLRIIKGHNKPITALKLSTDKTKAYSGSADGKICEWDLSTGDNKMFPPGGHSNQVQDMQVAEDELVTCGMDDKLFCSSASGRIYGSGKKLPSQPRAVSSIPGGLSVVACVNDLVVLQGENIAYTQKVDYEPSSVAIHPGGSEVAIGAAHPDNGIYVYTISGSTLVEKQTLPSLNGTVTSLEYSPDGAFLGACNADKKVIIYNGPDYEPPEGASRGWGMHTARVNNFSWSPNSRNFATGSLDTNILVWSAERPLKCLTIKAAHPMSQITGLEWLDENTLLSAGQDSCLRLWSVTPP